MERPPACDLHTRGFTFHQQQNAVPAGEGEIEPAAGNPGINGTNVKVKPAQQIGDKDTVETPRSHSSSKPTGMEEKKGQKQVNKQETANILLPGTIEMAPADSPKPGEKEAIRVEKFTNHKIADKQVPEMQSGRIEKAVMDSSKPGEKDVDKQIRHEPGQMETIRMEKFTNHKIADKQVPGIQPGRIEKAPADSPKPGGVETKIREVRVSDREPYKKRVQDIEKSRITVIEKSPKGISRVPGAVGSDVTEILLPGKTGRNEKEKSIRTRVPGMIQKTQLPPGTGESPDMKAGGTAGAARGISLTGRLEKPAEKYHELQAAKEGKKNMVKGGEAGLKPANEALEINPGNEEVNPPPLPPGRSHREAALRIRQLRQEVHRLNAGISSPLSGAKKEDEEDVQKDGLSQQANPQPPQAQPVGIMEQPAQQQRTRRTPCAFWERSYLGRFHLKNPG
jgi:hypothetical protein